VRDGEKENGREKGGAQDHDHEGDRAEVAGETEAVGEGSREASGEAEATNRAEATSRIEADPEQGRPAGDSAEAKGHSAQSCPGGEGEGRTEEQ